ncbi:hypothetical protein CDIK_1329 [Cucumispora dikerogammari]|nr:hypothetical protein CDIK_1329 [Cucumispora dikerogammari]
MRFTNRNRFFLTLLIIVIISVIFLVVYVNKLFLNNEYDSGRKKGVSDIDLDLHDNKLNGNENILPSRKKKRFPGKPSLIKQLTNTKNTAPTSQSFDASGDINLFVYGHQGIYSNDRQPIIDYSQKMLTHYKDDELMKKQQRDNSNVNRNQNLDKRNGKHDEEQYYRRVRFIGSDYKDNFWNGDNDRNEYDQNRYSADSNNKSKESEIGRYENNFSNIYEGPNSCGQDSFFSPHITRQSEKVYRQDYENTSSSCIVGLNDSDGFEYLEKSKLLPSDSSLSSHRDNAHLREFYNNKQIEYRKPVSFTNSNSEQEIDSRDDFIYSPYAYSDTSNNDVFLIENEHTLSSISSDKSTPSRWDKHTRLLMRNKQPIVVKKNNSFDRHMHSGLNASILSRPEHPLTMPVHILNNDNPYTSVGLSNYNLEPSKKHLSSKQSQSNSNQHRNSLASLTKPKHSVLKLPHDPMKLLIKSSTEESKRKSSHINKSTNLDTSKTLCVNSDISISKKNINSNSNIPSCRLIKKDIGIIEKQSSSNSYIRSPYPDIYNDAKHSHNKDMHRIVSGNDISRLSTIGSQSNISQYNLSNIDKTTTSVSDTAINIDSGKIILNSKTKENQPLDQLIKKERVPLENHSSDLSRRLNFSAETNNDMVQDYNALPNATTKSNVNRKVRIINDKKTFDNNLSYIQKKSNSDLERAYRSGSNSVISQSKTKKKNSTECLLNKDTVSRKGDSPNDESKLDSYSCSRDVSNPDFNRALVDTFIAGNANIESGLTSDIASKKDKSLGDHNKNINGKKWSIDSTSDTTSARKPILNNNTQTDCNKNNKNTNEKHSTLVFSPPLTFNNVVQESSKTPKAKLFYNPTFNTNTSTHIYQTNIEPTEKQPTTDSLRLSEYTKKRTGCSSLFMKDKFNSFKKIEATDTKTDLTKHTALTRSSQTKAASETTSEECCNDHYIQLEREVASVSEDNKPYGSKNIQPDARKKSSRGFTNPIDCSTTSSSISNEERHKGQPFSNINQLSSDLNELNSISETKKTDVLYDVIKQTNKVSTPSIGYNNFINVTNEFQQATEHTKTGRAATINKNIDLTILKNVQHEYNTQNDETTGQKSKHQNIKIGNGSKDKSVVEKKNSIFDISGSIISPHISSENEIDGTVISQSPPIDIEKQTTVVKDKKQIEINLKRTNNMDEKHSTTEQKHIDDNENTIFCVNLEKHDKSKKSETLIENTDTLNKDPPQNVSLNSLLPGNQSNMISGQRSTQKNEGMCIEQRDVGLTNNSIKEKCFSGPNYNSEGCVSLTQGQTENSIEKNLLMKKDTTRSGEKCNVSDDSKYNNNFERDINHQDRSISQKQASKLQQAQGDNLKSNEKTNDEKKETFNTGEIIYQTHLNNSPTVTLPILRNNTDNSAEMQPSKINKLVSERKETYANNLEQGSILSDQLLKDDLYSKENLKQDTVGSKVEIHENKGPDSIKIEHLEEFNSKVKHEHKQNNLDIIYNDDEMPMDYSHLDLSVQPGEVVSELLKNVKSFSETSFTDYYNTRDDVKIDKCTEEQNIELYSDTKNNNQNHTMRSKEKVESCENKMSDSNNSEHFENPSSEVSDENNQNNLDIISNDDEMSMDYSHLDLVSQPRETDSESFDSADFSYDIEFSELSDTNDDVKIDKCAEEQNIEFYSDTYHNSQIGSTISTDVRPFVKTCYFLPDEKPNFEGLDLETVEKPAETETAEIFPSHSTETICNKTNISSESFNAEKDPKSSLTQNPKTNNILSDSKNNQKYNFETKSLSKNQDQAYNIQENIFVSNRPKTFKLINSHKGTSQDLLDKKNKESQIFENGVYQNPPINTSTDPQTSVVQEPYKNQEQPINDNLSTINSQKDCSVLTKSIKKSDDETNLIDNDTHKNVTKIINNNNEQSKIALKNSLSKPDSFEKMPSKNVQKNIQLTPQTTCIQTNEILQLNENKKNTNDIPQFKNTESFSSNVNRNITPQKDTPDIKSLIPTELSNRVNNFDKETNYLLPIRTKYESSEEAQKDEFAFGTKNRSKNSNKKKSLNTEARSLTDISTLNSTGALSTYRPGMGSSAHSHKNNELLSHNSPQESIACVIKKEQKSKDVQDKKEFSLVSKHRKNKTNFGIDTVKHNSVDVDTSDSSLLKKKIPVKKVDKYKPITPETTRTPIKSIAKKNNLTFKIHELHQMQEENLAAKQKKIDEQKNQRKLDLIERYRKCKISNRLYKHKQPNAQKKSDETLRGSSYFKHNS